MSLLLRDREVPDTSLGPETGNVTENFGGFPQPLHGNARITPQIMTSSLHIRTSHTHPTARRRRDTYSFFKQK